jgi:hypothetical protein
MARYKITKIYMVDAGSRIDARNIFTSAVSNNKEDEFLEFVSITESDRNKANGWGQTIKQQLTGTTNGKR